QAVELLQDFADPSRDERHRRARRRRRSVQPGVENTIAPRLPRRGRPAGGRTHAQPVQEQSAMAPKVAMRNPDLQIAEQQESQLTSFGAERSVLLIRKQLAEAVQGDLVRALRLQLRA